MQARRGAREVGRLPAVRNAITACATGFALALGLGASSAWAASYVVDLRGVADRALRTELRDALSSFPNAPTSRLEARRRAEEAGEKVIAVLRSEGHYDYQVAADIGEGDTPQPFVTIDPGPRSTIADSAVDWSGSPPSAPVAAAALAAMALKTGEPGRAADVIAAEGRIIAALHEHGYADAKAASREVIVEHDDHTVRPTFHITTGELVRLDGIRLSGSSRTRATWVRWLAPWKPGQIYRPEDLAQLELRLAGDGRLRSAVNVSLAPADGDGRMAGGR